MADGEFGKVQFEYPEDLVRYSFLVQKSLTPLDLSTCEKSYLTPTTFTEAGFQNLNAAEDRRVLFEYHLDISHGLEEALKEHDPVDKLESNKYDSSVYRGFKVAENYLYQCVLDDIMRAIEKSQDKTTELKKFLSLMKIMRVSSNGLKNQQYCFFARIFKEACADSNLIVEFLKVCGKESFDHWLLRNNEETEYMDFFLRHTQKMKLEMYPAHSEQCPVSRSLFVGKYQCAVALIKYGKMKRPLDDEEIRYHVSMFSMYSEPAMNWLKYNRRPFEEPDLRAEDLSPTKKWLLLLLVDIVWRQMENEKFGDMQWEPITFGIQALQMMWRSLPEPYLTQSQVRSVWRPDSHLQKIADQVYTLYKTEVIVAENPVLALSPRTLQHLARCEIRGRLADNCELPTGIELLGLPHPMQRFLSLEH